MNIIAHWSMNDPTILTRVWDNSGNGHHGSFGDVKPEVVKDSPNGQRAMRWPVGASTQVTLPGGLNPRSVSFWIKQLAGSTVAFPSITDTEWHSIAVSGNTLYVDAENAGTQTVEGIVSLLESALGTGQGFIISDIYYYSDQITESEIDSLVHVKTSIVKGEGLRCKEFSEEGSTPSVLKNGTVKAGKLSVGGGVNFFKKDQVTVQNIVEF